MYYPDHTELKILLFLMSYPGEISAKLPGKK